jgi:hypothetical protein
MTTLRQDITLGKDATPSETLGTQLAYVTEIFLKVGREFDKIAPVLETKSGYLVVEPESTPNTATRIKENLQSTNLQLDNGDRLATRMDDKGLWSATWSSLGNSSFCGSLINLVVPSKGTRTSKKTVWKFEHDCTDYMGTWNVRDPTEDEKQWLYPRAEAIGLFNHVRGLISGEGNSTGHLCIPSLEFAKSC